MAVGLTVTFVPALGLPRAISLPAKEVTGCVEEMVAGSIAIGLGGYLTVKADLDYTFAGNQYHYPAASVRSKHIPF